MSDIDPYETPPSTLDDTPQSMPPDLGQSHLASRGTRLGDAIIDGVLSLIVTLPFMIATGYFAKVAVGETPIGQMILLQILAFGVYLAMHGYLLSKYGQSIGKKLVGIKIVDYETDALLPLSRIASKRLAPVWVATLVPIIGNILVLVDSLCIFRNDRRCIHDLIAGTKVVYAPKSTS
jgi:uncharacterized RDD family membrane protein YckC